jgi:hypothetical protein
MGGAGAGSGQPRLNVISQRQKGQSLRQPPCLLNSLLLLLKQMWTLQRVPRQLGQGLGFEMRDLALLLLSQELGFACEVSNRVAFLHKGQIEEEGNPQEVLLRPRSERMQAF